MDDSDDWYFGSELTAARTRLLEAHDNLRRAAKGSHAYGPAIEWAQRAETVYFRLLLQQGLLVDRQPSGPVRLAHISAQRSGFQLR